MNTRLQPIVEGILTDLIHKRDDLGGRRLWKYCPIPEENTATWVIKSSHDYAFKVATLIREFNTYADVDVRVGKVGHPSLILRIEGCNLILVPALFQLFHKSVRQDFQNMSSDMFVLFVGFVSCCSTALISTRLIRVVQEPRRGRDTCLSQMLLRRNRGALMLIFRKHKETITESRGARGNRIHTRMCGRTGISIVVMTRGRAST